MNHQGTKRLETERLILRRATIEDAEFMYQNWASDDRVTEYLTWPTHSSVDISKMVIESWIQEYENPDSYNWIVELKETGEPIGSLGIAHIDEKVDAGELGWCIGYNWWGKGIMPEAAHAVVKYLFEEVDMKRICACHNTENPKSGRAMQKLGMVYEGTLRKAGKDNRGIADLAVYSILKEEFKG